MAASVRSKRNAKDLKYTILLPTYNERENIALIVWLLIRTLKER